jgi:hypothetical protein
MMGFGFEFETDADDVVRCYWKEGVNVGVSGTLRRYPVKDITFAVLAVGEHAAWTPIKAIDEAGAHLIRARGHEPGLGRSLETSPWRVRASSPLEIVLALAD